MNPKNVFAREIRKRIKQFNKLVNSDMYETSYLVATERTITQFEQLELLINLYNKMYNNSLLVLSKKSSGVTNTWRDLFIVSADFEGKVYYYD